MFEYEEELLQLKEQLAHYEARDDWQKVADFLGKIASHHSNWPISDENSDEKRSQAKEYYNRQLEIYEHIDDPQKIIESLLNIGDYLYKHSYCEDAIEHFTRALEICDITKDLISAAHTWGKLASLHLLLGNYEDAYMYADRAINAWEGEKNKLETASSWAIMGHILQVMGDYQESYLYINNALNVFQTEEDDIGLGITLRYLGDLYLDIGELSGAFLSHTKAYDIAEKENLAEEQLLSLMSLAKDTLWLNRTHQAEELIQKAWDLAEKYGLGYYSKQLNIISAIIKRNMGRLKDAIYYITEAQNHQIEQLPLELENILLLNEILLLENKANEVLGQIVYMLELSQRLDLPRYLWRVHYIIGRCYDLLGETVLSNKEYQQTSAYLQLILIEVPEDNQKMFIEHPERKPIFELLKQLE